MAKIRTLSAEEMRAHGDELAEVLFDSVAGGASVNFMADFTRDQALAYWREIASEVEAGKRIVFVTDGFDGTAQLIVGMPPNQVHRGELAKMLVHRRARRRGLARALFEEVEQEARRRGLTLITFDTMSGSPAERLYLSCGCVKVGEIPGYALWPEGGEPGPTSVFFKILR
jgi:GNAT superfamily N-acetyltransferase